MAITIDKGGWITGDPAIQQAPRPQIEHGELNVVRGIIVHQTGSANAASTLASYQHVGANGAHFLIDKDGTTYQVASLYKKTWHVGNLRAKCLETHTCTAGQVKAMTPFSATKTNAIEMKKSVPLRFPANEDSIGIELVGMCVLDPKLIKPGMKPAQIENLRNQSGVYDKVAPAQNLSLQALIKKIQTALKVGEDQVYPHSEVSYKNKTEGTTAVWQSKQ